MIETIAVGPSEGERGAVLTLDRDAVDVESAPLPGVPAVVKDSRRRGTSPGASSEE